jgi:hypothetical protein
VSRSIVAYTEPGLAADGQVVSYLNVSEGAGGSIEITVRDNAGVQAMVRIPVVDWFLLAREMYLKANHIVD